MGIRTFIKSLHDPRFDNAACIGHLGLFDSYDLEPPQGKPRETLSEYRLRLSRAKTICKTCPVFEYCETTARQLPRGQRIGIWAGVDLAEKNKRRAA